MARTAQGAKLTQAHRAAQLAARAGSLSELVRLWRVVDPTNLKGTIDTFAHAAAILATGGERRSAEISANYYPLFRRVEIGAAGSLVRPAPSIGIEALAGDIRGAALSGILKARRGGLSVPLAADSGLVRVAATLGKLVLNGGRRTLITATENDKQALGYARVTSGDPCAFCRALAGRGAVYKTEKSADFEAHDGCACSPEALYRGSRPPGDSAKYAAEFKAAQVAARKDGTMSSGTSNDALNNYRRYLAGGATASPSPVTGEPG
jgi:hypothetical protein